MSEDRKQIIELLERKSIVLDDERDEVAEQLRIAKVKREFIERDLCMVSGVSHDLLAWRISLVSIRIQAYERLLDSYNEMESFMSKSLTIEKSVSDE